MKGNINLKKKIINCFCVFIVTIFFTQGCFAYSDNSFHGVKQYATADKIRHVVDKKILVIQHLEKGEKSRPFHCFIIGGDDALIYQNCFDWGWHSNSIEMRHLPYGINITFLSDNTVMTHSITKTLTIVTADEKTIIGTCYYLSEK